MIALSANKIIIIISNHHNRYKEDFKMTDPEEENKLDSETAAEYHAMLDRLLHRGAFILQTFFRQEYARVTGEKWEDTLEFGNKFINSIGQSTYRSAQGFQKPFLNSGDVSKWDINILSHVFRSVDFSKGLTQAEKACIKDTNSRMKSLSEVRNFVAHTPAHSLTRKDFDDQWAKANNALGYLTLNTEFQHEFYEYNLENTDLSKLRAVPERESLEMEDDIYQLVEHMKSLRFSLRACSLCKKEALHKCSRCKLVAYCSKEHQVEDWKNHKEKCRLYTVKKDSQSGKNCLIAAKDLEPGTIIILEKPILQFPETVRAELMQTVTVSWCLSCGVFMNKIHSHTPKCTGCGWPICSPECQKLPIHKNYECKLFSSNKIKYEASVLKDFWAIFATVRAMMIKENEPDKWKEILSLGLKDQTVLGPFALGRMGANLGQYFRSKLGLAQQEETLMNGAQAAQLTATRGLHIRIQDKFQAGKSRSGYYLYSTASKINHSCIPNTYWKIGNAPDFELQVRVMVPVKKGEEITLSRIQYTTEMRRGTYERQICLRSFYSQICECSRCADPAEMGSYMSAIKCPNCQFFEEKEKEKMEREKERNETTKKNIDSSSKSKSSSKSSGGGDNVDPNSGYLVYKYPLALFMTKEMMLKCNKCESESPLKKYHKPIFSLVEELDKLERADLLTLENTGKILKNCHDLIEKYSGKILHPNHYAVFRASQLIVTREYRNLRQMTETQLDEYIKNCYYILEVLGKINPGFSCFQGTVTFHLVQALKRKADLMLPPHTQCYDRVSEYVQLLSKIIILNEQAIFFYKDELPHGRDQVVNEWYKFFICFMKEVKELRNKGSKYFGIPQLS